MMHPLAWLPLTSTRWSRAQDLSLPRPYVQGLARFLLQGRLLTNTCWMWSLELSHSCLVFTGILQRFHSIPSNRILFMCRHRKRKYGILLLWKQTWKMTFFSPLYECRSHSSRRGWTWVLTRCGERAELLPKALWQAALRVAEGPPRAILAYNLSHSGAQSLG